MRSGLLPLMIFMVVILHGITVMISTSITTGRTDLNRKWEFAETLLAVLEKTVKQLPDEIFQENGFKRNGNLFFAAMSDGDYIEEMLDKSVKMFNSGETLEAYGMIR